MPTTISGTSGVDKVDGTTFDGTTVSPLRIQAFSAQTASGTSIEFTGLPSWAKEITVMVTNLSTNGTANPLIQIGDNGGVEPTGYLGASARLENGVAVSAANFTTGFGIPYAAAGNIMHGSFTISLLDAATNTWVCVGNVSVSSSLSTSTIASSKSLSATLDRIRFTTTNGTDSYDQGTIGLIVKG